MNVPFPFGLPISTAFYLIICLLTLVIHVLFMNYVLAGTALLALAALFAACGDRRLWDGPIVAILRDWMPFALSAAITAGVAPLLFVQILYKRSFYSANLLLFHRWMIIVPVLMVGFYLLYLIKARNARPWPRAWRVIAAATAFGCMLFTGCSWTENHLLSLNADALPSLYESGAMIYRNVALVPRLAMWTFGAFPTLCVLLAWQLRYYQRRSMIHSESEQKETFSSTSAANPSPPFGKEGRVRGSDEVFIEPAVRTAASERAGPVPPIVPPLGTLSTVAFTGLLLAALSALWYYAWMGEAARDVVTSPSALPYLVLAILGWLVQCAGWTYSGVAWSRRSRGRGGDARVPRYWRSQGRVGDGGAARSRRSRGQVRPCDNPTIAGSRRVTFLPLWGRGQGEGACESAPSGPVILLISMGLMATMLGIAVVRESIRLASMDLDALSHFHSQAISIGGKAVFFVFFLLNAALIAWCFRLVHAGLRRD